MSYDQNAADLLRERDFAGAAVGDADNILGKRTP